MLGRFTQTRQRCWFGLWEGYGWIQGSPAGLAVRLPNRDYILLEGPLESAMEIGWRSGELLATGCTGVEFDPSDFHPQPPNLIWPEDRAWFVASEIDLDSTYVGGSADLIEALLADDRLEALPADRGQPIDAGSDQIN